MKTMTEKALLRAVRLGRKDEVLPAGEHSLRWGRRRDQRVTIRGVRLFGRKGGPVHAQVFTGTRWVSVVTIPWLVCDSPMDATCTGRAIKCRLRTANNRGAKK
jgi:hypothetical protein